MKNSRPSIIDRRSTFSPEVDTPVNEIITVLNDSMKSRASLCVVCDYQNIEMP